MLRRASLQTRSPGEALVFSVLFASSVAGAEEGDPSAGSSETPDASCPDAETKTEPCDDLTVVVTGSRRAETRRESLVHVDVVTHRQATERGATNVGEALNGGLGVEVNASAYGSLGNPSAAQIGGLDRDRVLVLEDGERVVGDVGGAIDLSRLTLAGVERIEIVQGPQSALYGSSAMGGVIQIISGPPEVEGFSGRLQLEGRYRWGGYASLEGAYRDEDRWIRIDGSFYGSEGVSLAPPETAIGDQYRTEIGARGGFELAPHAPLTISLRYARDASLGLDTDTRPGLGVFEIDLPDTNDRVVAKLRQAIEIGEAHEVVLSLAKQWFFGDSTRDRRDSPLDELRSRRHTMHSVEANGTFFRGEVVSFAAGARAEVEQFDQTLDRTTFTSGAAKSETIGEVEPTTLGSGALYAEGRVDPLPEISATAGARLEASPRYGAAIAPRIATAFRPLDALTLRLSGGRGYRAPSAKEVGFVFDHSSLGYVVVGNPDLVPETSWGLRTDIDWRVVRGLDVAAGGFVNWLDDAIDLQLAGSSGVAGIDQYTYVNIGSAITAGANASVRAKVAPWLVAEGGYSFLWTRDGTTGAPLQGRPPHTLRASLRAATPIGLSMMAQARGVTDAYLDETTRSPAFMTIDARIGQRLWPKAEAYVGASNVVGVQKSPDRIGDQRPLEGRTIWLGLMAELPAEEAGT